MNKEAQRWNNILKILKSQEDKDYTYSEVFGDTKYSISLRKDQSHTEIMITKEPAELKDVSWTYLNPWPFINILTAQGIGLRHIDYMDEKEAIELLDVIAQYCNLNLFLDNANIYFGIYKYKLSYSANANIHNKYFNDESELTEWLQNNDDIDCFTIIKPKH